MDADNNLNIVLIGMMGSGKSYIGNKLSKLLSHFTYTDIDEEIEYITDLTISEIFEEYGETYFRELEAKTIKEFSKGRNQVISIGGGAFETQKNITALRKNGLIFYLKAPAQELYNRIKKQDNGEKNRPMLKKKFSVKTIENILKTREKNYLKADFVIDTNQKQAYTILDDILKEYENYVKQKTIG